MTITVVNKYKHKPTSDDFYIGRGSPLGNPYTSRPLKDTKAKFQCKTNEIAIKKYEEYLKAQINVRDIEALNELRRMVYHIEEGNDVNLVCFCSPKPCHGEVVKKVLEKIIENRKVKKVHDMH